MAEVEISYKGSTIASMSASGTKTLLTEGKYLEDDVTVAYSRPSAPSGTKQISVTQNGTTTEDVTAYASAEITANVPNSYSAGDEGKVVSSGALVSQSSATYTTNNTYDTTLVNSVTVNVSGGGGGTPAGTVTQDQNGYLVLSDEAGGGGRVLPSTYTARNYIQTAGDAYIDTGIHEYPVAFTGFEGQISAYHSDTPGQKALFGYQGLSGTTASAYRFMMYLSNDNTIRYYGQVSGESSDIGGWVASTADTEQVNNISASFVDNATYPVFTVNNTETTGNKKKTTTASAANGNMYLLAQNIQGGGPSTYDKTVDGTWIRCHWFKIYCFGGVVRDFVPCTRNADGVAGFYDFVTEGFYPSIGENAFTYG